MLTPECTAVCWESVQCDTCGRTKAPIGRSVPMEAANGYCNPHDCPGYELPPKAPHLWWEERRGGECDPDYRLCECCNEYKRRDDVVNITDGMARGFIDDELTACAECRKGSNAKAR